MNWKNLENKKWFPYTVAVCSGVILYMALSNLGVFLGIFSWVGKYFGTVILGTAIAYIINPLAKFLQRRVLGKTGKEGWGVSCLVALILVLLIIVLLMISVIPQLITSIKAFADNLDMYIATAENMISNMGLAQNEYIQNLIASSNHLLDTLGDLISDNLSAILSTSANVGKGVANVAIAVILSLYILLEKQSLRTGVRRFLRAITSNELYRSLGNFYQKCDDILTRYITCSVLESVIVGSCNAMFMTICGMEYTGLISVIVALTNLIPNFGPIIGGVISGFFLLLVNPYHALMFIIFTAVLQTVDAYIIKPKLFGNSLGVSGLMILISVVVFGKIFGIIGIVLAIPAAAIIEYAYSEIFLTHLENRKKKREEAAAKTQQQ